MKVLIACEYSGAVRDAFIGGGHDAMSCDLLPTDAPGPHYQGDVRDVIDYPWDLMIAHPPCTALAVSGSRWFKEKRMDGRQQGCWLGVTDMTEQDRIAASKAQAEAIAATKRAADQAHRERIHAEIETDIDSMPLDEYREYLPQLVEAIAAGRIRHLTIDY